MKILHVVPYFPPDRIGGVGEMADHLHRGLLKAGHESFVVTSGTSWDDPTVERIAPGSGRGWMVRVRSVAPLARGFDVVHVHGGEALALALAMRVRRIRTPILATYHVGYREFARAHRPYEIEGHRFGRGWANFRYRTVTCGAHRIMDRLMLSLADGLSFISRSSARDILGDRRGEGARVVYNAVPGTEGAGEADDAPRSGLLYVGNAGDRKRITALPFVLGHIQRERPGTRLTIVGADPGEAPRVHALFREFGLQDLVSWEGRLLSGEITEHYRRAEMVLVPSASEGLPMVILEAFRAGTPCVATRVSGHPEAVEPGVNGLLVEPDDPAGMAEACVQLLRDPGRARRMGTAARGTVRERFSVARQVREYLDVYRGLVSARAAAGTQV